MLPIMSSRKTTDSRRGRGGGPRLLLLLAAFTWAPGASAQPQEETVPEGVLGLAEIRVFVGSPLWHVWKLPGSKHLLGYVQWPASIKGGPPRRQLVVLDGKGRPDMTRTAAVQES